MKLALRKGKKFACRVYGEPLSTVKRWCRKYDEKKGGNHCGDKSHRPLSPHPEQHMAEEEGLIRKAFSEKFFRWGWPGVNDELVDNHGYTRGYWGMRKAAARMKLTGGEAPKESRRKQDRRFPELKTPGEKVQIDVKFVPYNCLKGAAKRDGKHLYQYECTRIRFVYGYDEHTPENSCDFLLRPLAAFPFPIQCVQTDNGAEFTYRFLEGEKLCPFEELLGTLGIAHKLIPPRTPWHNGKVERSHRTDQRYFYDWEKFGSVKELNEKLAIHLAWYNNRRMAILGWQSPAQRLAALLPA